MRLIQEQNTFFVPTKHSSRFSSTKMMISSEQCHSLFFSIWNKCHFMLTKMTQMLSALQDRSFICCSGKLHICKRMLSGFVINATYLFRNVDLKYSNVKNIDTHVVQFIFPNNKSCFEFIQCYWIHNVGGKLFNPEYPLSCKYNILWESSYFNTSVKYRSGKQDKKFYYSIWDLWFHYSDINIQYPLHFVYSVQILVLSSCTQIFQIPNVWSTSHSVAFLHKPSGSIWYWSPQKSSSVQYIFTVIQ